jgi:hypothetical protein
MAIGGKRELAPFVLQLKSRGGGVAKLETQLMPNQQDLVFDYQVSWLLRQPGNIRLIRTWEIDPPEGIKYGGPGSLLFSPWFGLPWLFVDFDPDEIARVDSQGIDVRIV